MAGVRRGEAPLRPHEDRIASFVLRPLVDAIRAGTPDPGVPAHEASSAESQNRTGDTAIFSRVLYQLSYLGLKVLSHFPKAH